MARHLIIYLLLAARLCPSIAAFQIRRNSCHNLLAAHPQSPEARRRPKVSLALSQDPNDFWNQQKMLMEDLKTTAETSLANEEKDKYNQQVQSLIAYSAYTTFFIFCALWTTCDSPFVAFSYLFGSTLVRALDVAQVRCMHESLCRY
jgi:hypothetical protein